MFKIGQAIHSRKHPRKCGTVLRIFALSIVVESKSGVRFSLPIADAVTGLKQRVYKPKPKSTKYVMETLRKHYKPISVVDTRQYAGPSKGGTRHKMSTQSTVLEEARQHKAKQSGAKFVDGVPAEEVMA
jgi:hypothetical protein